MTSEIQRPPSELQWRVLSALATWFDARGYSPTCTELAKDVGKRKGRVYELVVALEKRGLATHIKWVHRSLRPTNEGRAALAERGLLLAKAG